MKKIIVLLICIFPLVLWSQSKLGFSGSLDYSYRNFGNSGLQVPIYNSEKGKLNYHFNLNYNQKLKEKLWLKVGLGFTSSGFKSTEAAYYNTNPSKLDSDRPSFDRFGGGTTGGVLIQEILVADKFKKNYHFLEIPIAFRFEFSTKKITPFIEFGFSAMYYLQSESIYFSNGKRAHVNRVRFEEVNPIQIAPTFAFGSSYTLNEKWEFFIQPNFRFHLTKMRRELEKENLWSAGLALGLRMDLK